MKSQIITISYDDFYNLSENVKYLLSVSRVIDITHISHEKNRSVDIHVEISDKHYITYLLIYNQ